MKDLSPLEKEFFYELVGFDYDPNDGSQFVADIENAKAVAALCEKKIKESIPLVRSGSYVGVSTYSKWVFDYTEKEIIAILNKTMP